jgi:hypothetical protein
VIIDFDEEKRARRRVATLDDLITNAHQALRNLRFRATGVFVVIKSTDGDEPPALQYVQEGVTQEELERAVAAAFTNKK